MASVMEKIALGSRIGFLGLGKSNLSLISCLPLDNCAVTLRSEKKINRADIPSHIKIEKILEGVSAFCDIDEQILICSPSIRRERCRGEREVIFTSDCELFLERNKKPLFAVSGSDGKSTTATLAHMLLDSSLLVGNIGVPMTESLNKECGCYVAELSSFMLQYASVKAERACITNITPNHLDWHKSFEEYRDTKLSLLGAAKECIINADDKVCGEYKSAFGLISDKHSFAELKKRDAEVIITLGDLGIERNGELILPYSRIARKEAHNIKNLMMAIALTDGYTDNTKINEVASSFSGLPHRCEVFLKKGGAEYINSSIDSSPARTVQTLESLGKKVVLLLGGKSKGVGYEALTASVKKYAERALIFGENREEIYEALKDAASCEIYADLASAAVRAMELESVCEAVLLSPASTSYDAFSSFEERGNCFKKIINANKRLQNKGF